MELRFFAFALALLVLIPGSVLSEETTRQSKVRAVQRAAQQHQAAEQAQRCADAVSSAQGAEAGTFLLSSAVGLLPLGSAASSVAANAGTTAAGDVARQKAAAAVQGNCGG